MGAGRSQGSGRQREVESFWKDAHSTRTSPSVVQRERGWGSACLQCLGPAAFEGGTLAVGVGGDGKLHLEPGVRGDPSSLMEESGAREMAVGRHADLGEHST